MGRVRGGGARLEVVVLLRATSIVSSSCSGGEVVLVRWRVVVLGDAEEEVLRVGGRRITSWVAVVGTRESAS